MPSIPMPFLKAIGVLCVLFCALIFLWLLKKLTHLDSLLALDGPAFVKGVEGLIIAAGLAYVLFAKALRIKDEIQGLDVTHETDAGLVLKLTGVYALVSVVIYFLFFIAERVTR